MPREIWNEGRVVGYSAYEVYVKQQLSETPDIPPASERQWLASSIAMGSSMILQVPDVDVQDENVHTFVDIQFPPGTMLGAANNIMASFFDGDAEISSNWATRVTDYGDLISNTAELHPDGQVGPTDNISTKTLENWSEEKKAKLVDYMKIVDGIIIQPGDWVNTSYNPPERDFTPDLNYYPRIRLHIKGSIKNKPLVLLTGLTVRFVLAGVAGLDGSTSTLRPEDGDFLGPAVYPWASKVIFSVPSSYIAYFQANPYTRSLPSGDDAISVKDTAVIDMQACNPGDYYNDYQEARVELNVEEYSSLGDGVAVITCYQKKSIYPPALYGTFVDSDGTNYLNPLDIVAPGSIKMFYNADAGTLIEYQNTYYGTFAINKLPDGSIQTIDSTGNLVPIASIDIQNLTYTNKVAGHAKAKALISKAGRKTGMTLSMSSTIGDNQNPTQYTISNAPAQSSALTPDANGNFNWALLLEALANNLGVDVLEANLKDFKSHLPNVQSGAGGVLNILGTGASTISGPTTIKGNTTINSGHTLSVGKNYIDFNGLRLYISATEPTDTDVPDGSIGIGWGFR